MSGSPTATTIRLYCDGELPHDEARQVEAQIAADPSLQARVEFERRLREHTADTLRGTSAAPPQLSERVRSALRQEPAEAPVTGQIGATPKPQPARRPWWHAPHQANVFAVAASLTLVTAAVLFGIFGRPIDSWRGRSHADAASDAAAQVAGEHVISTSSVGLMSGGLLFRNEEDAQKGLAPFVGGTAGIFDLRGVGYEFVGGSKCDVPHCDNACHLFYRRTSGPPGLVSLHIVPDRGQFGGSGNMTGRALPLSTAYIPQSTACKMDVLVWTHEDLAYLLVVCIPDDLERIARSMQEALVADGSTR